VILEQWPRATPYPVRALSTMRSAASFSRAASATKFAPSPSPPRFYGVRKTPLSTTLFAVRRSRNRAIGLPFRGRCSSAIPRVEARLESRARSRWPPSLTSNRGVRVDRLEPREYHVVVDHASGNRSSGRRTGSVGCDARTRRVLDLLGVRWTSRVFLRLAHRRT